MRSARRAVFVTLLTSAMAGLHPVSASAATLTVNRSTDSGDMTCDVTCELRAAVGVANATTPQDTIVFDLAPDTITLEPARGGLPSIDQPLIIDGFSDPDSDRVELDGSGVAADGLRITADSSTVKGMVINNFGEDGIDITGSRNRVEGNYIGTDISGTGAGPGNGSNGVHVRGPNNTVGGETAEARNVISANGQNGVRIAGPTATGNHVEGNYIGTGAAGNAELGNTMNGVAISSTVTGAAVANIIGGTTAGRRNLISGNGQNGVRIFPSLAGPSPSGNLIQGNSIGTAADGIGDLGNAQSGVRIDGSSTDNSIGGRASGAGNTVSGNGSDGIRILGDATGNPILGNSIYSNDQLGIDLEGLDGISENDSGDGDVGANNFQNFPKLTSVFSATRIAISGALNSAANRQHRLEFFSNAGCDPSGHGEGQTLLGATNATTDEAGNAAFHVSLAGAVSPPQVVTATATDPDNNTSEFSPCTAVVADTTPPTTPATSAGGTFQKQRTFTVGWSAATDMQSRILGYEVRYRQAPFDRGFGTFVSWQRGVLSFRPLSTTTATSAMFAGYPGTTYCFSARAIDGAGNASPYGTEGCTALPVDDPTLKHRGRWAQKTGSGYYLETFSRTARPGARLTLKRIEAKVLAILVTKCRGCGVIKAFFNGKLLRKISLGSKAPGRKKLRVINLRTFPSVRTGTFSVKVASRGRTVIVEGLGVSAV